jgi:hypothetical protein
MSRIARIVAPGCPHPVTARGNRREPIFFEDGDPDSYLDSLAEQWVKTQVEVWSYGLMPNPGRLILTPRDEVGMGRAMGETRGLLDLSPDSAMSDLSGTSPLNHDQVFSQASAKACCSQSYSEARQCTP